eukprot:TRINITY_DN3834_c1_g1_i1.p1 TRINITY_DN3834_c1_g1~~TRINITY_DN3834_c1_g1_i1.p1  ORF type:complete len:344 (+),score=85.43 TRINITY_DN3834_c1_g1_i1:51-1082(+)
MQVKPGDKITVHGLSGRPELNGVSGILVGPGANGRVRVKLDTGAEIDLKPANLGVQAPSGSAGDTGGSAGGAAGGMPGFGGGMPGFGGGMPGFGGGMPGFPGGVPPNFSGMAKGLTRKAAAWLEETLASAGLRLPPGVSAEHACLGLVVAVLVALYFLKSYVPVVGFVMSGVVGYIGLKTVQGQMMLEQCTAKLCSATGRPIPPRAVLALVCLAVLFMGRSLFGGSLGAASGGNVAEPAKDAYGLALKEAYQQGYDDAVAGLAPRPPKHIPSVGGSDDGSRNSSKSSGFGFSSIIRFMMIAPYFFRLGQGPGGWNINNAIANLKANPGQAMMMLLMLSGGGMF